MVDVESVRVLINGKDNASRVFERVDKNAQSRFASIGNAAKVAGVALAGIGIAAGVGVGKAIGLASDFEETASKFAVVFDEVSEGSERAAKDLQENFGLSGLAAKTLLANTGDLLTGFGFADDQALELSETVNKLAVDLASFTNAQGGATAVSDALTKALLGERESLKTYGIAIQEADVQAQLLANGQENLTGEALRQAKAQATLELALRQSANAQGDFGRTQDSFANQSRVARARLEDLGVELGTVFLPFATKAISTIADFVTNLRGFTSEGGAAAEVFTILKDNANSAFEFIGEAITSTFDTVVTIFNENKEFIFDTFASLKDTISSVFGIIKGVVSTLRTAWDNNFLGINDNVRTTVAFLKFFGTVAVETFGGIVDTVSFVANNWEFMWENMKLTLFNFVNDTISTVERWANAVLKPINAVREAAGFDAITVDFSGAQIDTELTQARVEGLRPDQSLGEMLAERDVRLFDAGNRLIEDLRSINEAREQREQASEERDRQFLEEFRANQAAGATGDVEVNTINNVTLLDDASIAEYSRRQQESEREQLTLLGVTTV